MFLLGKDGIVLICQTRKVFFLISPKKITSVGTWNVRTLMATGAVTMLLHELNRFRWDVIGIAETHWLGVQESVVCGCKIISSGRTEGHSSGVGLLLSRDAQQSLMSYNPVNDRILSARFQLFDGCVTICQIYAPTAEAEENIIDEFYKDLQQEVSRIPKKDMIILMGDFNAKVGAGDQNTKNVLGMHGIGSRNERGDRLLDFCYANNLCITNTKFKQAKASRRWTWESPDQKTHNLIDYIIVSRKLMGSVRNSRSFPSADVGSDHQLVMANIRLKLKVKKQETRIKKVNIQNLKVDKIRIEFHERIEEKWEIIIQDPVVDVENVWVKIRDGIQEVSRQVLGYREGKKHEEWLSTRTLELMADRRKYKSKRKEDPDMAKHHNYLCRMVKESAKEDKEQFILKICDEVEDARTQNKTRAVYEGVRKIVGKHAPQVKSVKDEQGRILTDPAEVKLRWKNYFDKLYNDPNEVDEQFLENFPVANNIEDIPTIGLDEVEAAVKKLKHCKAAGVDNITVEEVQAATQGTGMMILHKLCQAIWEQEKLPSDWKRSVIIPIHKKKDKLDCSNYRGISLLCHSSKVFSSILLRRIKNRTEEILSEAQAGFRANRSTIDQIFVLRQLAEQYEEFGRELYVCYIDFKKRLIVSGGRAYGES